ncbi:hypothetical protein BDB00DRAFT_943813, partial [Zychaea mexicana]|uniref:uncharacterized protein n=1 Tax=Zychaea mexicana TaxID=64656 RepID=UPI0022FDB8DA
CVGSSVVPSPHGFWGGSFGPSLVGSFAWAVLVFAWSVRLRCFWCLVWRLPPSSGDGVQWRVPGVRKTNRGCSIGSHWLKRHPVVLLRRQYHKALFHKHYHLTDPTARFSVVLWNVFTPKPRLIPRGPG